MALLGLLEELLRLLLAHALLLTSAGLAFFVFRRFERQGRREIPLVLVLGALATDCVLFPAYGTTQGLLQPSFAGRSLTLPAVLAVVALTARASTGTRSPRITLAAGAWTAFFAWTLAAGARGLAAEHPSQTVLYQALVVLHVGALALLAATTPVDRLLGRSGIPLLAASLAPVALLLALADAAELTTTVQIPLVGMGRLGAVGGDAATLFSSLGVLAGAIAMSRRPGQRAGLVPAALLLTVALVAEQRAALLALVASVLLVAFAVVVQQHSGALRLLAAELALGLLLVAALGAAAVSVTSVRHTELGLQDHIERTFFRTAKQQSAQSRQNQWTNAAELARSAPLQGGGLGATYAYYEEGPDERRRTDLTHNVFYDVTVRTGAIGLVLLLTALGTTASTALRTLRSRRAPGSRALAAGALAALAGVCAKGLVESIFEKHRIAVLMGVVVGLALARQDPMADGPRDDEAAGDTGVPHDQDSRHHASAAPKGSADLWT